LILLAALAGTALLARRIKRRAGHPAAADRHRARFVPGMPSLELPPELVLLVVLPP